MDFLEMYGILNNDEGFARGDGILKLYKHFHNVVYGTDAEICPYVNRVIFEKAIGENKALSLHHSRTIDIEPLLLFSMVLDVLENKDSNSVYLVSTNELAKNACDKVSKFLSNIEGIDFSVTKMKNRISLWDRSSIFFVTYDHRIPGYTFSGVYIPDTSSMKKIKDIEYWIDSVSCAWVSYGNMIIASSIVRENDFYYNVANKAEITYNMKLTWKSGPKILPEKMELMRKLKGDKIFGYEYECQIIPTEKE